jgi:hypothetical protein
MTMSATENRTDAAAEQDVELTTWIQSSARSGDRIRCEWLLANRGSEEALVGFYLHLSLGSISELACSEGISRRGRFHGSATFAIPPGEVVTVSAGLQLSDTGDHQIRVVAVTRNETLDHTHTVAVANRRVHQSVTGTLAFAG